MSDWLRGLFGIGTWRAEKSNPNHEPAGSPIGGQFSSGSGGDSGGSKPLPRKREDLQKIVSDFEQQTAEINSLSRMELLGNGIGPIPKTKRIFQTDYPPAGWIEVARTSDEIKAEERFQQLTMERRKTKPLYDHARKLFAIEKGKRMKSRYAGKSSLSGKPFKVNEEIYYVSSASFGKLTVPVSEMKEFIE
jgi:hypothetical protein